MALCNRRCAQATTIEGVLSIDGIDRSRRSAVGTPMRIQHVIEAGIARGERRYFDEIKVWDGVNVDDPAERALLIGFYPGRG
jgi:hypothetical protein